MYIFKSNAFWESNEKVRMYLLRIDNNKGILPQQAAIPDPPS